MEVGTTCPQFVKLPAEEVRALLAEDELNARTEEAVWDAALRWVQHDPTTRRHHLVGLMANIRLGLLDTQVQYHVASPLGGFIDREAMLL